MKAMKDFSKTTAATIAGLWLALTGATDAWAFQGWDKKIDVVARRFQILPQFNNQAVLDKETGLVWQRSPSAKLVTWEQAVTLCYSLNVGNRMGWRLPAVTEMLTLVDPSQTSTPTLPANHPFLNVAPDPNYWTATSLALNNGTPPATHAYFVDFIAGGPGANPDGKGLLSVNYWCVRGGRGHDFQ
jgi:hypothetical protein